MRERDTTWFITKRTGAEQLIVENVIGPTYKDTTVVVRAVPELSLNYTAERAHFHKVWAIRPDTPFTPTSDRMLLGIDTLRKDAIEDSLVLDGAWIDLPPTYDINIVPSSMDIQIPTAFTYRTEKPITSQSSEQYPKNAMMDGIFVFVLLAFSASWLYKAIQCSLKISKVI